MALVEVVVEGDARKGYGIYLREKEGGTKNR